jgi:hypothetical protein
MKYDNYTTYEHEEEKGFIEYGEVPLNNLTKAFCRFHIKLGSHRQTIQNVLRAQFPEAIFSYSINKTSSAFIIGNTSYLITEQKVIWKKINEILRQLTLPEVDLSIYHRNYIFKHKNTTEMDMNNSIFINEKPEQLIEFYGFPSRNHLPNFLSRKFKTKRAIRDSDKKGVDPASIPSVEYAKKHYVAINKGIKKIVIAWNFSGIFPEYEAFPLNTNTLKSEKIASLTGDSGDYRLSDLWQDMFDASTYTKYALVSNSPQEYQTFIGWRGEYIARSGNIDKILEYIKQISGKNYKRFICWLAEIIQHPGKQTRVIPFFTSLHNELVDFICRCIGERMTWKYPTLEQLEITTGLVDKVLVILNQVPNTRRNFHEHSIKIAHIVNTPNISVVARKHVHTYANYSNIIMMGKDDEFIRQYSNEVQFMYMNEGQASAPTEDLLDDGNCSVFIDMLQDIDITRVEIADVTEVPCICGDVFEFLKEVDTSDLLLTRKNWYKLTDIYNKYKEGGGELSRIAFSEQCEGLGYSIKRFRLNAKSRTSWISIYIA